MVGHRVKSSSIAVAMPVRRSAGVWSRKAEVGADSAILPSRCTPPPRSYPHCSYRVPAHQPNSTSERDYPSYVLQASCPLRHVSLVTQHPFLLLTIPPEMAEPSSGLHTRL